MSDKKQIIETGRAVLGIEFGSTRIKAVLTDCAGRPLASGSYSWENRLADGIWTYSLEDIWTGLRACYQSLSEEVRSCCGVSIRSLAALGISGMMHGYMPFDKKGELLTPFRTWRNTMTGQACAELSPLLEFHIPQRWSVAHLYQAVLNGESHVGQVDFVTTLAGYVHWQLTGEKVVGVGEASGMFPIDSAACDYRQEMVERFDAKLREKGVPYRLRDVFPRVLAAGERAGRLTAGGAKMLDPSGELQPGIWLCPPEGDAGTGMAATNSVAVHTGNVSAGTSVFAMVVLGQELKKSHEELDMVTTPSGEAVAMVHCNNCTSEFNAWVKLFQEFAGELGVQVDMGMLYGILCRKALEGDKDCGGLLAYNYVSGEPVMGFDEGRPLFVRMPDSHFHLANFARLQLYAALGALKAGMDILLKEEGVKLEGICGHGGLFKTPGVGQGILAAALNTPVTVMETAGEGGAWGIALLAAYMVCREENETLAQYLDNKIFAGEKGCVMAPDPEEVAGFEAFMKQYQAALPVEAAAIASMGGGGKE
ncbi:MAG: FGGY-family carbohydrate kinase [Roseburia sp.]|nr:FGGY-family carbohydrate kinase [Roseburia sp.]MCM1431211.1 FGGY-family carbohydrate kinase [Muribaculaceae bacterium]